jgi:hypothetical protein
VQTLRGRHLWHRAPGAALPSLRAEGLPVDVKAGLNAYVTGPSSVRPDGGRYLLARGDLTTNIFTVLALCPAASSPSAAPPLACATALLHIHVAGWPVLA